MKRSVTSTLAAIWRQLPFFLWLIALWMLLWQQVTLMAFLTGLVLAVLLSVLITGQVAGDGRSDWLKGMQLLAVYLVLGLTFFFLPGESPP